MLKAIKLVIKNIPFFGEITKKLYLRAFKQEGEKLYITGGALKGKAWIRFIRTHNEQYVDCTYEPTVQATIAKYLGSGMTFYDVGANAGFFTLFGASIVGPTGTVLAFEPHPATSKELRAQMKANEVKNVEVIEAAVCDKVGFAKFANEGYSVTASLAPAGEKTITVATTTLDEVIQSRPVPDLLKIDVEGAEIEVLRGAGKLIASRRPILLVEIHSRQLALQYHQIMQDLGYRSFSLDGKLMSVAGEGERFVVSEPT